MSRHVYNGMNDHCEVSPTNPPGPSVETSRLSTHNWRQVRVLMTASESIPGHGGGLAMKLHRLLSSGYSSNKLVSDDRDDGLRCIVGGPTTVYWRC